MNSHQEFPCVCMHVCVFVCTSEIYRFYKVFSISWFLHATVLTVTLTFYFEKQSEITKSVKLTNLLFFYLLRIQMWITYMGRKHFYVMSFYFNFISEKSFFVRVVYVPFYFKIPGEITKCLSWLFVWKSSVVTFTFVLLCSFKVSLFYFKIFFVNNVLFTNGVRRSITNKYW